MFGCRRGHASEFVDVVLPEIPKSLEQVTGNPCWK
jgi:hypothetical protein